MAPRPEARRTTGRPSVADDERGVVSIEFALVLPVVLLFVLAIVDFGRAFNYVSDANQIAANGARFAAVDSAPGGGSLQDYLVAQGDTRELRDGGSRAIDQALSACIDFPSGTSNVGDPVRVKVSSAFELVPMLGGVEIPIEGEATMRIERPPTTYSAGC